MEDGVGQFGALAGVAVVGVPVAFGDVGVACLGDGFGEGVIDGRESFGSGDDEDGARRDLRGKVEEVERLPVVLNLAGEREAAGAGEWGEVVVPLLSSFASSAAVEGLLPG